LVVRRTHRDKPFGRPQDDHAYGYDDDRERASTADADRVGSRLSKIDVA